MLVLRLTLACLIIAMVKYSTGENNHAFIIKALRNILERDVDVGQSEKVRKTKSTKQITNI
jgi:hypothetical protein